MPDSVLPQRPATRAFAHVIGPSSRVKAAPTPLNPRAADIMAASGTIKTRMGAANRRVGRTASLLLVVLALVGLCAAGTLYTTEERAARAEAGIAQPDDTLRLGLGDYRPPPVTAAAAPAAPPPLGGQDRFEVARLARLSALPHQRQVSAAPPTRHKAAPRARSKAPAKAARRAPGVASTGD